MTRAASATVGVLVGGAVGAVTALLLAPKRGEEIRADVKEWTREKQRKAAEKIRELGSTAASSVRQLPRMVTEKAPQWASSVREKFRRKAEVMEGRAEEIEKA